MPARRARGSRRASRRPSECGGSTQALSPEWIAGLLDVLHDPADPDVLAVAQRVDVDLDRVLQEAVEEDLAAAACGACASR